VDRILQIEEKTKHDVIAFLTNVEEYVGPDSRFIHMGLTSSDILDTSFAMLLKEAMALIIEDVKGFMTVLKERAFEHKNTVMMGRSHGIHAEPITFGLKLAVWYAEMKRNLKRLEAAHETINYGKLSGSVGTFANVSPKIEALACKNLGLKPAEISTQILQRDRHAEYFASLAILAGTLEKIAVEIRHLQRTEVLEAEEAFTKGQKGSSAMPHKRNPITGERLTGLARVLRANALAALENVALWHERDISHSSVERIIFPDSCTLLDYMLATLTRLTDGLVVYPENMKKNLRLSLGMWNSQTVLLALIRKGLTREAAYELVQRNAMQTWATRHAGREDADFLQQLQQDPEVARHFAPGELEGLCSLDFHIKAVDERFRTVGLA
jgi:adenylosuccinate lyase